MRLLSVPVCTLSVDNTSTTVGVQELQLVGDAQVPECPRAGHLAVVPFPDLSRLEDSGEALGCRLNEVKV
jgi:hypothetical protein